MLDRFVDVCLQFLSYFRIAKVVEQYERGVVLRFGKFQREVGPGLHLLIPLGVDTVYTDNVVPTTMNLGPQSLTSKDGKLVVLTAIVTWEIACVTTVLLAVEGADGVLTDTSYGTISQAVAETNWEDIRTAGFALRVTKLVRKECKKWGIKIIRVRFSDKTTCRSIRLWQEQA